MDYLVRVCRQGASLTPLALGTLISSVEGSAHNGDAPSISYRDDQGGALTMTLHEFAASPVLLPSSQLQALGLYQGESCQLLA